MYNAKNSPIEVEFSDGTHEMRALRTWLKQYDKLQFEMPAGIVGACWRDSCIPVKVIRQKNMTEKIGISAGHTGKNIGIISKK